jgi:glutathione S-transferase
LLLTIDPDLLSAECRDDEIAPGVFFPHVYGPIDLAAVVAVTPLTAGTDGAYVVPQA